jgi:hypothetical protein
VPERDANTPHRLAPMFARRSADPPHLTRAALPRVKDTPSHEPGSTCTARIA